MQPQRWGVCLSRLWRLQITVRLSAPRLCTLLTIISFTPKKQRMRIGNSTASDSHQCHLIANFFFLFFWNNFYIHKWAAYISGGGWCHSSPTHPSWSHPVDIVPDAHWGTMMASKDTVRCCTPEPNFYLDNKNKGKRYKIVLCYLRSRSRGIFYFTCTALAVFETLVSHWNLIINCSWHEFYCLLLTRQFIGDEILAVLTTTPHPMWMRWLLVSLSESLLTSNSDVCFRPNDLGGDPDPGFWITGFNTTKTYGIGLWSKNSTIK